MNIFGLIDAKRGDSGNMSHFVVVMGFSSMIIRVKKLFDHFV